MAASDQLEKLAIRGKAGRRTHRRAKSEGKGRIGKTKSRRPALRRKRRGRSCARRPTLSRGRGRQGMTVKVTQFGPARPLVTVADYCIASEAGATRSGSRLSEWTVAVA